MKEQEMIRFTWTLESEEAEARVTQLREAGADAEKMDEGEAEQIVFLAPLVPLAPAVGATIAPWVAPIIIAGTASFAVVIDKMIKVLGLNKPGLIIDVRGNRLDVSENKGIPHHSVLVITSKGTKLYDLRNDDSLKDLSKFDAIGKLTKDALDSESGGEGSDSGESSGAADADDKGGDNPEKKEGE